MKRQYLNPETDGFYGAYYPCKEESSAAIIYMLGQGVDNFLVKAGVKWLHGLSCHVLAVSPEPEEKGFHEIPLERFGKALSWLKKQGITKTGIAGGSATAMMALTAASFYEDITLTITMTPCDFIMEGYYRDRLDGTGERPGNGESFFTWKGKPLPYLPFAYRHPEYWYKIKEESKRTKNMIASRELFDRSEEKNPLTDEEMIRVERIRGTLILAGAEDDCLWDTCRYIRRMKKRLLEHENSLNCIDLTYKHGTHFLFPDSMLKKLLPVGSGLLVRVFKEGRNYPGECKKNRKDMEEKIVKEIRNWKNDPGDL